MTADTAERSRVGLDRLAAEWRVQDVENALDELECAVDELRDIATGDHGYGDEGHTAMAIDKQHEQAAKALGRLRALRDEL